MSESSTIQFQIDPQWEPQVDTGRLEQVIRTTLAAEGVAPNAEMTFVVVDDAEMGRLHEAYRGESGPTDVLSFPYDYESGEEEMEHYLGDVIVDYEQAMRQSADEGHTVEDELLLLAVHGTLHLLGYDDEKPEEKGRMWQRQRAILEQVGLAHVAPR